MYIMAPELISTTYFINPSHQSVCLYVYPSTVARQWLGKHVPAAMNIRSNRKFVGHVCLWVCLCIPFLVARKQLGKDVPAATKNCWRRRFLCGP
jgi:hypothetical protein